MMMLALYRGLLCLYPAAHRKEFGLEMLAVINEGHADARRTGLIATAAFCAREVGGLLSGAFAEHIRASFGFQSWPAPSRRFVMRPEFRFPKATPVLMALILGGVVLAIEKARAIVFSLPHTNPPIAPIRPAEFTFFPTILLMFVFFYALGFLGWAVMFALRRSGVHRLTNISVVDRQE
jgi:hypothetical protein